MTSLEKYAELIIKTGINIQKNQTLVINAPIQTAEFARLCAIKAYEFGAKEVVMNWSDEHANRIHMDMAADEVFDEVKEWLVCFKNHYADIDAASLVIGSNDPEIMKGVDPSKFTRIDKAYAKPLKSYYSRLMSNKFAWCVACVPNEAWAKKVYPNKSAKEAVAALWQNILSATRADLANPVAAWQEHQTNLNKKLTVLNQKKFKKLIYKNSIGTNVTVELPETHIWYGGADTHTTKNYKFVANIPTEEIYTLAQYNGVNGKIVSSYPLSLKGTLIKDFWFEFKDGVVVDYGAGENLDALSELLKTDEGAKRLGEVALVPYDSPISNLDMLFYNTLFDENASCHFALGEAYPICIEAGEDMTDEELLENGANVSMIHVDFMIGTKDLDIMGITQDGEKIQIFSKGNFAF